MPNFEGADLTRTNFCGQDLVGRAFVGANLSGADLHKADYFLQILRIRY